MVGFLWANYFIVDFFVIGVEGCVVESIYYYVKLNKIFYFWFCSLGVFLFCRIIWFGGYFELSFWGVC